MHMYDSKKRLWKQLDHGLHDSTIIDAFWISLDLVNHELAITVEREIE